jgi:hypothetical protein
MPAAGPVERSPMNAQDPETPPSRRERGGHLPARRGRVIAMIAPRERVAWTIERREDMAAMIERHGAPEGTCDRRAAVTAMIELRGAIAVMIALAPPAPGGTRHSDRGSAPRTSMSPGRRSRSGSTAGNSAVMCCAIYEA